ncbi:hypothetical protein ACVMAJ_000856 [Bradyrhizobium sp. USDA 4448]
MLDLEARVHLQEVEALVLASDELDGAGGIVVHGLGQRDGLLTHLAAGGFIEQRRWRLFDDLLIAALDRAFALAEIDHVAMLVAEHLNLDMAGIDDEFFDEDAVVAERGLGFGLGEIEAFGDLGFGMRNAHALAATAGRGLDHHGIADLVGDPHRVLVVLDDAEIAGHGRDLGFGRRLLGFDLVAHRGDRAGVGTDEDDAGCFQRPRKRLALGQEAVAGMDRLGAGFSTCFDDLLDHQIALGRSRRADQDGLVGHLDMESVAVGLGIHGNRLNSHLAGGLDDPAGDFAAVGDQDAFEHVFLELRPLGGTPPGPAAGRADGAVPCRGTAKSAGGNGLNPPCLWRTSARPDRAR